MLGDGVHGRDILVVVYSGDTDIIGGNGRGCI